MKTGVKRMKLIDKYIAIKFLAIKVDSIGDIYENKELKQACHKGMSIAYNLICDVPTIEAIPISWIEEWCKCLRENVDNISYENFNMYQEGYEDCLKMERLLSMMINDWRKENDTN